MSFKIEGFAKNYFLINNRWEDHILTALSREDWGELSKKETIQDELITNKSVSLSRVLISDASALLPLYGTVGLSY